MDNNNTNAIFVVAVTVVVSQLMAAYTIFFDDVPTKFEQRMRKRKERELTPYTKNLSVQYGPLTSELVPQPMLDRLLLDKRRVYMFKVMHLHTWQFMMLANRLKELIEKPRFHCSIEAYILFAGRCYPCLTAIVKGPDD